MKGLRRRVSPFQKFAEQTSHTNGKLPDEVQLVVGLRCHDLLQVVQHLLSRVQPCAMEAEMHRAVGARGLMGGVRLSNDSISRPDFAISSNVNAACDCWLRHAPSAQAGSQKGYPAYRPLQHVSGLIEVPEDSMWKTWDIKLYVSAFHPASGTLVAWLCKPTHARPQYRPTSVGGSVLGSDFWDCLPTSHLSLLGIGRLPKGARDDRGSFYIPIFPSHPP